VSTHSIDTAIFNVASVLQVPVLILALVALAVVVYELGSYAVEVFQRRGRSERRLEASTERARVLVAAGDRGGASDALREVARSATMSETLAVIVSQVRTARSEHRLNKALADFDFASQRRLARTRLLVRAGPALGLMGTLIPLSPALTGLADGNTQTLSRDLRVAFSVTVVGLLIGAVAFGISLSRDRLYGQDLSDLEYVAAVLDDGSEP
jgi:biopolymer transport protein ExbB/TolQ